jgi:hypothetical protein
MKNLSLDQLLPASVPQVRTEVPSTFQQDVWREIHHRQAIQSLTWQESLDAYLALLLQPGPVMISLILAIVIGVLAALPSRTEITPSMGLYAFHPRSTDINIPGEP